MHFEEEPDMELEIFVNRDRCMGTGQCVYWTPGVFSQDEDAIAVVVDPHGEPEAKVVAAANRCPTEAISLKVDGVEVEVGLLVDWHRGSLVDAPLVSLLETFGNDHDDLRGSLDVLRQPASREREQMAKGPGARSDLVLDFVNTASAHLLHEEEAAFPAIGSLVGPPLVDVFERNHAVITERLHALMDSSQDRANMTVAVAKLAGALDDLMRLEEAILFPMALGAFAGEASSCAHMTGGA
jgi:ferredoxin